MVGTEDKTMKVIKLNYTKQMYVYKYVCACGIYPLCELPAKKTNVRKF